MLSSPSWVAEDAVKKSETRMCTDILNSYLVDRSRKYLELRRIMREIFEGDVTLKFDVESQLTEKREQEEAIDVALLAEEESNTTRM